MFTEIDLPDEEMCHLISPWSMKIEGSHPMPVAAKLGSWWGGYLRMLWKMDVVCGVLTAES